MAQNHTRESRKDVFDHLARAANRLKGKEEYEGIQMAWAKARNRKDAFYRDSHDLKQKIGNVEIIVRPQLGRVPCRLELLIKIPEGVKKSEFHEAMEEALIWRKRLTDFQGTRALLGIRRLAHFEKLKNGKYKFVHAEPLVVSNALNQRMASLLEQAESLKGASPQSDPPFNSAWCINEVRELLREWKILESERWINRALSNIRSGGDAFETAHARNRISRLIGPFTPQLIKKRFLAWRRSETCLS